MIKFRGWKRLNLTEKRRIPLKNLIELFFSSKLLRQEAIDQQKRRRILIMIGVVSILFALCWVSKDLCLRNNLLFTH